MKISYIAKKFQGKSMAVIHKADEIIEEYAAMGYELTLRQLYYQFVARDLLPNTDKSYDQLGKIVSDARLAGLLDWNAIKDRTRHVRNLSHWDGPAEIIDAAIQSYRRDHWEGQGTYVEVWVEKDALIDVIEQAAEGEDIACFSCRGYVSQTAMWEAACRFIRNSRSKEDSVLLHFGDHDPSGIDMTRDIQDRLDIFGANVEVKRIALTMDQVEQYNPPPNPAKLTDSRCVDYMNNYGEESWELDALEPPVLAALIEEHVAPYRDMDIWNAVLERENVEREALGEAAENMRERFAD